MVLSQRLKAQILAVLLPALAMFFIAIVTVGCTPEQIANQAKGPEHLTSIVDQAALSNGVPIHLARGIAKVESNYNPHLRGRAGEYGLMQIKCPTAREVGFTGNCSALFDPATNANYAMKYARLALDRAGGDPCHAATLYNAGLYSKARRSSYCRRVLANQ